MAQGATPPVCGRVIGHSSDGLRTAEVHGVVASSHLRVFGDHLVELRGHFDVGFDIDALESGAKDGPVAER